MFTDEIALLVLCLFSGSLHSDAEMISLHSYDGFCDVYLCHSRTDLLKSLKSLLYVTNLQLC